MTSAPALRAICGVPSIEPPSATMIWSTRWRGNSAMTAPMDSASLSVGITTATLSPTGDLASKAGEAVNDGLLTSKLDACGIGGFFCGNREGHKLQRRPQLAQAPGGLSDCNARRNA